MSWFTLLSEIAGERLFTFIVEGDAFEGEPFLENGVESGEALNYFIEALLPESKRG